MDCIISSLLQTSFKARSTEQQRDILRTGRPMPALTAKLKDGSINRKFNPKYYNSCEWLAGSEKLSKVYCWPCLLLWNSHKTRIWATFDLKHLKNRLTSHAGTKDHILCEVGLKRLHKSFTSTTPLHQRHATLSTDIFNANVRKNRKLLEHLIDVTVLFATQELSLSSLNSDNFKDVFLTFIKRDLDLRMHCDTFGNMFVGRSSIQQELVASVEQEVLKWIKRELLTEAAAYVVQVDSTGDITERPQCSVIARFVDHRGEVTERFLGYHDVTSAAVLGISDAADVTACDVSDVLDSVLCDVAYNSRLIAQSYDGAAVAPNVLAALRDNVRSRAPAAMLVHSPTHRLDALLTQGARYVPATRLFFAALQTYPSYLRQHPSPVLQRILDKHVPSLSHVRWGSVSRLLTFVSDERCNLMLAYEDVLSSTESSSDSLVSASSFLAQLKDFHFVFLLTVYNDVLKLTTELEDVLRVNTLDVLMCCRQVEKTVEGLCAARTDDQATFYVTQTTLLTGPPVIDRKCGRVVQDDYQQVYRNLLEQILDNVIGQLEVRFKDLKSLEFIQLIDNTKFLMYSRNFPLKAWKSLNSCFPLLFDFNRLKGELEFMYADDEFACKSPQRAVTLLVKELGGSLSQALKLYSVVLAILPFHVAASCLDRVRTHLHSSTSHGKSWLSIETDLLRRLQKEESWYDGVTTCFANTTKRKMELFYKQ